MKQEKSVESRITMMYESTVYCEGNYQSIYVISIGNKVPRS